MFERSGCLRRLGETTRKKRQGYEVICDISFCSVSCVCYQLSAEDLSQLSKDIAMKSVRSPAILAQVAACHRYARRFLKRLAVEWQVSWGKRHRFARIARNALAKIIQICTLCLATSLESFTDLCGSESRCPHGWIEMNDGRCAYAANCPSRVACVCLCILVLQLRRYIDIHRTLQQNTHFCIVIRWLELSGNIVQSSHVCQS